MRVKTTTMTQTVTKRKGNFGKIEKMSPFSKTMKSSEVNIWDKMTHLFESFKWKKNCDLASCHMFARLRTDFPST